MMTDKPGIRERYQTAASSGGDRDVLGAFGLADRRLRDGWVPTGRDTGYHIPKAPLAVALERLFSGDNHASREIVELMAAMVFDHSWKVRVKISRPGAYDMACAVLAWHRDGVCKPCGGHGLKVIPGAPILGERSCESCGGVGKIPFDEQFTDNGQRADLAELAHWLLAEVDREAGRAAPEAMKALAERMNF